MVQDASEVPETLEDGLERARRQGMEGYEDAYGNWVDPRPVQLGAIRQSYREAADEDGFNIFSVVPPTKVRDDKTIQDNMAAVHAEFERVSGDVAEEVADQIEAEGYDLDRESIEGQ